MLHVRGYKISFLTRNLRHSLIHLRLHCLLLQFDSLYYLKNYCKTNPKEIKLFLNNKLMQSPCLAFHS